ncbi:MAG: hypothetical protein CME04_16260 [Gemmatimonadaceae bacterium]|mgnify:CR=1 FL=1|nr:hypothetical protein [Gemmatimonadaceae bacterium]
MDRLRATQWPPHRVRENGEKAAAQLVHLAEQRDSVEICRAVCAVLERCGAVGFTTLARMLSSRSQDVCEQALVTLMYNFDVALPTLEDSVRESDGDERHFIERLIDAGRRLQQSEVLCWTMRPATLARVVALGDKPASARLGKELISAGKRDAYHASRGLVYVGQAAVAELLEPLQSPEPLVRRRACEALRDLAAPESRPALRAALQDTDVGVRINATRALGRIGHAGDLELLRSRPGDKSRAVRRAVREALDR